MATAPYRTPQAEIKSLELVRDPIDDLAADLEALCAEGLIEAVLDPFDQVRYTPVESSIVTDLERRQ